MACAMTYLANCGIDHGLLQRKSSARLLYLLSVRCQRFTSPPPEAPAGALAARQMASMTSRMRVFHVAYQRRPSRTCMDHFTAVVLQVGHPPPPPPLQHAPIADFAIHYFTIHNFTMILCYVEGTTTLCCCVAGCPALLCNSPASQACPCHSVQASLSRCCEGSPPLGKFQEHWGDAPVEAACQKPIGGFPPFFLSLFPPFLIIRGGGLRLQNANSFLCS